MPTPFQHLVYAVRVLESPALPDAVADRIGRAYGAYLLGNTAPDVQAVTGQKRVETHFYRLPPPTHPRAGEVMLAYYPELASPMHLPAEQAAFISGYLVHLVWDEVWAWEVFLPFYCGSVRWSDRKACSIHHNALRVVMDRQAEVHLRTMPDVLPSLQGVEPHDWLPFVEDWALRRWRDWLVEQLREPHRVQTLQVFAHRLGVSEAHLASVAQAVARRVDAPPVEGLSAALHRFEQRAQEESVLLLRRYWHAVDSRRPVVTYVPKYQPVGA